MRQQSDFLIMAGQGVTVAMIERIRLDCYPTRLLSTMCSIPLMSRLHQGHL